MKPYSQLAVFLIVVSAFFTWLRFAPLDAPASPMVDAVMIAIAVLAGLLAIHFSIQSTRED